MLSILVPGTPPPPNLLCELCAKITCFANILQSPPTQDCEKSLIFMAPIEILIPGKKNVMMITSTVPILGKTR